MEDGTPLPKFEQTPLFRARHESRYMRQDLIRAIESATGRRFISFVCGRNALIDRDDVVPFVDLLADVDRGGDIDLLLHTPGGDIDAVEKLVAMIRDVTGSTGVFRVVVPDCAKSAGTMLDIAADKILMGPTSELGPIDPQIGVMTADGFIGSAAQSYIDAFQDTARLASGVVPESLTGVPIDEALVDAYSMLLQKFDPVKLDKARKEVARSKQLAGKLLKPKGGAWTKTVEDLLDVSRWSSHTTVISAEDAQNLGLAVEVLSDTDPPLWELMWRLYVAQRPALIDTSSKLFEGRRTSLQMPTDIA